MTETVRCWRCGRPRPTFESCPHCGGSCKPLNRKKQTRGQPDRDQPGFFTLPENCRDLFDVFLSPPIRRARQEAIQRIEAQDAPAAVKTLGKALATIQAVNVQGRVNRQERRQKRKMGDLRR